MVFFYAKISNPDISTAIRSGTRQNAEANALGVIMFLV